MNRSILYGFLAALLLAVFLAPFASSSPDGLERVADVLGFAYHSEETQPLWNRAPVPDYSMPGFRSERLATSVAGLLGTLAVFTVIVGVFYLMGRGSNPDRSQE